MGDLKVWIYSGAGNTFAMLDNQKGSISLTKEQIQRLCQETLDGVVLLEKSLQADFAMRIFNSDGNEASMCGNALRLVSPFLFDLGQTKSHYRIETKRGILETGLNRNLAFATLPNTKAHCTPTIIDGIPFYSIDTGVMHAVAFIEDIEKVDWSLAKRVRFQHFQPGGTNVNFAMICNNQIFLRTYEKGVERETLACGTGAAATAIAYALKANQKPPFSIIVRSGEKLFVDFSRSQDEITALRIKGPFKRVSTPCSQAFSLV